ncbi:MAG TPA: thioredoxin family protein [Opitutaceae bacterium]|nr:thioredoxin family protein [Opitutaceae bacterium]
MKKHKTQQKRSGWATHPVVSQSSWLKARKKLLDAEKALTRQIDSVRALRQQLPWVKVVKPYVFTGPEGAVSLSDLFRGRSQLIVQHFMFAPGWEEGCEGCSFLADHVDGARLHFEHHDVAFVAVSRAPLAEFAPFKQRMRWMFPWVSSHGSSFNYDFGVSFTPEQVAMKRVDYNYGTSPYAMEELHGTSVFAKRRGNVFHTYSTYARGADMLMGAHHYLDLTPRGRNDQGRQANWLKLHDRYENDQGGATRVQKEKGKRKKSAN